MNRGHVWGDGIVSLVEPCSKPFFVFMVLSEVTRLHTTFFVLSGNLEYVHVFYSTCKRNVLIFNHVFKDTYVNG